MPETQEEIERRLFGERPEALQGDPVAEAYRSLWDSEPPSPATGELIPPLVPPETFADPSKAWYHPPPPEAAPGLQQLKEFDTLGKILNVLEAPERASASMADYLVQRRVMEPPQYAGFIDFPQEPLHKEEIYDLVDRAWGGLSNKYKFTYDDFTRKYFPDMDGWPRMALSLTLAIALDPSLFVPTQTIAKGVKGLKAAKRARKAVEESIVGKAFIPGAGTPKRFHELRTESRYWLEWQKDQILRNAEELSQRLSKKDRELITYLRQHPDEIVDTDPKILQALEDIGGRFDSMIDRAYTRGLITESQYKTWNIRRGTYLPGISVSRKHQRFLRGIETPWITEKPFWLKKKTFETLEDRVALADSLDDLSKAKNLDEFATKATASEIDTSTFVASQALEGLDDADKLKLLTNNAKTQAEFYRPITDSAQLLAMRELDEAVMTARKTFYDSVLDPVNGIAERIKFDPSRPLIAPEGKGFFFSKGRLRFFPREILEPRLRKDLEEAAEALHEAYKAEIKRTKTTTTITGDLADLAESGHMVKIEAEARDAFMARGRTKAEADQMIRRMKTGGKEVVDEFVEKTIKQTEETIEFVLGDQPGELLDAVKIADYERVIPGITKRVPVYMVDQQVARELRRAGEIFSGNEVASTFLRWMDTVQNQWKVLATSVRLPFHLRNFYSNCFLAWQAGLNNPRRFTEAAALQIAAAAKKWDMDFLRIGNKTYTVKQLHDLAGELGVRGRGWIGSDVQLDAAKELAQIMHLGRARYIIPQRAGRAVGTAVEDNARLAVFIDQLRKGVDPKEAAKTVRKYLFDYQELTHFERRYMRRIIPFYTWLRKNSALQAEMVLTKPRKYQITGKALRAKREPETVEEQIFKPEYFNELVYIKTDKKSPQGKPIYQGLDLPPLEFNRITNWRDWAGGVSPFKSFLEVAFNKKIFPDFREMSKNPLDMQPAPAWVHFLAGDERKEAESSGLIGPITNTWGYQDPSGNTPDTILGANKIMIHLVHSWFPVLNEMGRVHAYPITLTDERPEMWKRSYLTGVQHKTLDTQWESLRRSMAFTDALEQLEYFVRQRGRVPTSRAELETLLSKTDKHVIDALAEGMELE